MRVQTFYLIRPKQRLKDLLADFDELSREVLAESQLWESAEGGKTMWSPSDYAARAKLAFLLNLRTEYAASDGVTRLFRGARASVKLFDENWDIEALDLAGDVEEFSKERLRQEAEPTGLANLDEWLARET